MTREPGVSVVVATFDGAAHVREQLDSIAAQTVPPLEILVGDDGSTDQTVSIVKDFAAHATVPVHLTVNPQRLGYAENFLRTATAAKGEFIAFADQDDVWLPTKLEAATSAFARPATMMWMCGWQVVDRNLKPLPDHRFHTGLARRSLVKYPMYVPHGARSVFRGRLLDLFPADGRARSVYGDQPAHHDEWILFAAQVLGKVEAEATPRMFYRRHDDAVSGDYATAPTRSFMLSKAQEAFDDNVVIAARDRVRYLRARADGGEVPEVAEQLRRAADNYEHFIPRLVRRHITQGGATRSLRAKNLLNGFIRGDYRPLAWRGLGTWVLLQDIYCSAVRDGEWEGVELITQPGDRDQEIRTRDR